MVVHSKVRILSQLALSSNIQLGSQWWRKVVECLTHIIKFKGLNPTTGTRETLAPGVNFINICGSKAEQILRNSFLMILTATAFGKNVPKYGALCKSCGLIHAVTFWQKCWWNRTASFAPFTLYGCLCALSKLVGENDSRWVTEWQKHH